MAVILTLLVGLSTVTAQAGDHVKWDRIDGNVQTFDLVGLGTGQVTGAAPWATTRGKAKVNLETGQIKFKVKGLILTVGSVPGNPGDPPFFSGLPIGTTAGVPSVIGTLVCDVNGSQSETMPGDGDGDSVLVDTMQTPLNAQGDAQVIDFVIIPDACTEEPDDIAFLVRIAGTGGTPEDEPPGFDGLYIAFGAVRTP